MPGASTLPLNCLDRERSTLRVCWGARTACFAKLLGMEMKQLRRLRKRTYRFCCEFRRGFHNVQPEVLLGVS